MDHPPNTCHLCQCLAWFHHTRYTMLFIAWPCLWCDVVVWLVVLLGLASHTRSAMLFTTWRWSWSHVVVWLGVWFVVVGQDGSLLRQFKTKDTVLDLSLSRDGHWAAGSTGNCVVIVDATG